MVKASLLSALLLALAAADANKVDDLKCLAARDASFTDYNVPNVVVGSQKNTQKRVIRGTINTGARQCNNCMYSNELCRMLVGHQRQ
jgi:hypothetical protein